MPVRSSQRTGPEPKRVKTAHNKCVRRRSQEQQSPLTIQSFPHILDAVIDGASPEALRALRGTCREIKDAIDRRFSTPTQICRRVDPNNPTKADNNEPGVICGYNVATGLRVQEPPRRVQVLDTDADANTLWYEQGYPFVNYQDGYYERWIQHEGESFEDRMDRNVDWFSIGAPLARYMPHRRPKLYGEVVPLRTDPLSVYFCNIASFVDTVKKYDKYWIDVSEHSHTVFNVSLAPRDNQPIQGWFSFPEVLSNRLTVIFTGLDFEESAKGLRHAFVSDMLHMFIRNYVEISEPRACLVGYETWTLNMLPRPDDEAYWSSVDCEGPMKDFQDSPRNRLDWWIGHYSRVLESQMEHEEAEFGLPMPTLSHPNEPIKLLTLAEWREQIGETYFELMTDPRATYSSKEPLPPFKGHAIDSPSEGVV